MKDYVGRIVKKFTNGTSGPLTFSTNGNNGFKCGSYGFSLKNGDVIYFLKKTFPKEAKDLYINPNNYKESNNWIGPDYSSSPDAIKSTWVRMYNKVGAEKFIELERQYVIDKMFSELATDQDILPIKTLNTDRGLLECFISLNMEYGTQMNVIINGILNEYQEDEVIYVDKETLFDYIYDIRYQLNPCARFERDVLDGSSEREELRKYLVEGTISGVKKAEEIDELEEDNTEEIKITPIDGTIEIISDKAKLYRSYDNDQIIDILSKGERRKVEGISSNGFYKLKNTLFVHKDDVILLSKDQDMKFKEYKIRVIKDEIPIYRDCDGIDVIGTLKKNQTFNIINERNRLGLIKSKTGWIPLDDQSVKKLNIELGVNNLCSTQPD